MKNESYIQRRTKELNKWLGSIQAINRLNNLQKVVCFILDTYELTQNEFVDIPTASEIKIPQQEIERIIRVLHSHQIIELMTFEKYSGDCIGTGIRDYEPANNNVKTSIVLKLVDSTGYTHWDYTDVLLLTRQILAKRLPPKFSSDNNDNHQAVHIKLYKDGTKLFMQTKEQNILFRTLRDGLAPDLLFNYLVNNKLNQTVTKQDLNNAYPNQQGLNNLSEVVRRAGFDKKLKPHFFPVCGADKLLMKSEVNLPKIDYERLIVKNRSKSSKKT